MTVRVVFETHQTSEDNEAGIATGWLPGRLSALGRRQAGELGERRREDGLAAVFCSDLRRAVETVEIAFADADRPPVLLDWRLRECDYGKLNGAPRDRVRGARLTHLTTPYPGGESWQQAVDRVGRFLTDLLDTWVAYYAEHPADRALHAASSFEVDTEARVSVRTVIHRHYLEVLRPLVRDAHVRGDLRADCDTDALLSLLLMIFPHMALAPYVRGMDPVLGLDDPTPDQPALAVRRLVAVLADAFASKSPARMTKEVNT